MEKFGFFRLRFRRAYDSAYDLASPAGIFRGARISPQAREEIRAPLKMPAGEATYDSGFSLGHKYCGRTWQVNQVSF